MITPDGRLGSDEPRWGFHPYGMASRRDGKLVLRIFPYLGKDVDSSMRYPYLPIRWRGKTYLASTEDSDLRGFCRAAILAYPRGRSLSARNVYVRKWDEEQEGAALPPLPISVWWRFVIAELTFQDDDGLLRIRCATPFDAASASRACPPHGPRASQCDRGVLVRLARHPPWSLARLSGM